ncbi:hypothetical protein [Streptomyces melanogenes]|uniref:hypothetical protein n=1 Tax=Streptomyces melanogenes TaxID=67326 RepID=UPI00167E4B11|nr:hypothetical protein [Streptomyces melanogenes]GGP34779.1 hypothetical protein GCM10010278_08800 [Streptomyces melanogenes]
MNRSIRLAALALTALALTTACGGSDGDKADAGQRPAQAEQAAAPAVTFPAPSGAPAPAATLAKVPAKGEVRLEQGPFTDRVRVTKLQLSEKASGKSSVTGHFAITSDVSDVLALELRAAFYDESGHLVGTGSFQYAEEGEAGEAAHGTPGHAGPRAEGAGIDFTAVPKPPLTGKAASAVLSVPVLVNE